MRRRCFLQTLTASGAVLALGGCGGAGDPDCSAPPGLGEAERAQRSALHYRDRAGDRVRNCAGCNFYTAASAPACGACSLGLGAVSPAGVCDGFAARA
jgi:hypothetical protein